MTPPPSPPHAPLPPLQAAARHAPATVAHAKRGIHPEVFEAAKVICNGEEVLVVSGTKPEYVVDVWSGNHPFYTGALTQTVAEESRIAQFQKKYGGMYGAVAPVSAGGNTKLDYKKPEKGSKGKGKK